MTLQVYDNADALARALAASVCATIEENPRLVLGLPTGRTPLAFYAELRAVSRVRATDWSGVRTFNLDEFAGVSVGHPGSYRAYMQRELFDHVNVTPAHIGFLAGDAADVDAECVRYEAAIAAAGGLDLIILGIGSNGHIGFNEPAPVLQAWTHRVQLEPSTRASNQALFEGRLDRVPAEGLSMGMATILRAKRVILIATGGRKAAAVARMMEGTISTELPASFLQLHSDVTVMLDRLARPEAGQGDTAH